MNTREVKHERDVLPLQRNATDTYVPMNFRLIDGKVVAHAALDPEKKPRFSITIEDL